MAKKAYRTWSTGEIVTAAQLNEQIRDNGNAIWVGLAPGDMDYYSAADAKTRIGIGTETQVLKVVNGVPTWRSLYGCRVYRTTPQLCYAGTETVIDAFDGETFDSGYHTGSAGFLSVPSGMSGAYMIQANGYFDNHNIAAKLREIGIRVGSYVVQRHSTVNPANDTATHLNICTIYWLNVGDTVSLSVLQGGTDPLNFRNATLSLIKLV